ncbi:hypothetical protein KR084_008016 [Drosophila pseudotakahashii]|nr:hypothetical protein KR084_008016 [Drosophila pseudotakahashii]
MPESVSPPHVERRMCGMGNHRLQTPYRTIRNPNLLKFGRLINSELQMQPLCLSCYNDLLKLYTRKMTNAKRHQEERRQAVEASISTVSASESSEATLGITTSSSGAEGPPARISSDGGASSDDDGPTTSAAAAAKRAKRLLVAPSSSEFFTNDDDDPNSNLSLNAVNGTRLPHIQPIPKRRQFVHLNKEAMDIYLAGTTGG